MPEPTPIIEFRNVVKAFDGKAVIEGLSFVVNKGETFCIVGGSGAGKSVTLKLLLGLVPVDEGEIFYMGNPITGLAEEELCRIRLHFGMVFQGAALFDSLTVYENVAYPLIEQRRLNDQEVERIVLEKLGVVGLTDTVDLFPADLSGGMRKRIGLARAIATDPEVILYDEPTAGLDPANVNRIDELIMRLKQNAAVTSVLVTHAMESVFRVADRVALLLNKKAMFVGTLAEFKNSTDPMVRGFIRGKIGDE